jgi:prepilin-type N-terminal cleavage/methylation domain-containing protein
MKRGFTLLEMSIVLAIIATVIGGVAAGIPAFIQTHETEETQARQRAIQQALYDFRLAYNRIPCPADVTQAVDLNTANSNYFGIEAANPGACTGGTPAANFSNPKFPGRF